MEPEINIGEIIQQILAERGLSASWLARQIVCDESNFCHKLKENNLSKEQIYRISIVLKVNLFGYYSEEIKSKW